MAQVQLEAAWEPRLRPMLLALKSDQLKVLDDQSKEVKPQTAKESDEVVVRPENPVAEININLAGTGASRQAAAARSRSRPT